MMNFRGIIQSVDQLESKFLFNGNHIRIKKGKYLSASIIGSIGCHEREILVILERDNQVKQAGFMVAIPGELYTHFK